MQSFNKVLTLFLSLLVLSSVVGATYLDVQGPVTARLYNGSSIYLGKVGPGETFYVSASATTADQSGTLVTPGWDTLTAINYPLGWSTQASPLYGNPMKIKVTVAPNALTGPYSLTLRAINARNYSGLGNLTFTAYINVTLDVFNSNVSPTQLNVGVGEPANIKVVINNTGASDDPFVLNAQGLPAWNLPTSVIASHSTNNTYIYPVFENTPGVYNFNMTIDSSTSSLIHATYPATLVVQSSVLNDFGATGQGVVLSPVIYEPAYAFMLFLNDVYHWIFK